MGLGLLDFGAYSEILIFHQKDWIESVAFDLENETEIFLCKSIKAHWRKKVSQHSGGKKV